MLLLSSVNHLSARGDSYSYQLECLRSAFWGFIQAHNAFTPEQRAVMRRHVAGLHHAPLDNIEYIGGGGVRCSLAELF